MDEEWTRSGRRRVITCISMQNHAENSTHSTQSTHSAHSTHSTTACVVLFQPSSLFDALLTYSAWAAASVTPSTGKPAMMNPSRGPNVSGFASIQRLEETHAKRARCGVNRLFGRCYFGG